MWPVVKTPVQLIRAKKERGKKLVSDARTIVWKARLKYAA